MGPCLWNWLIRLPSTALGYSWLSIRKAFISSMNELDDEILRIFSTISITFMLTSKFDCGSSRTFWGRFCYSTSKQAEERIRFIRFKFILLREEIIHEALNQIVKHRLQNHNSHKMLSKLSKYSIKNIYKYFNNAIHLEENLKIHKIYLLFTQLRRKLMLSCRQ